MHRIIAAAVVCILLAPLPASAVTIDTVLVSNPGNANDTTGLGGVAYTYRIGTYEVTNAQYVEFLNAKAKTDPLGLYNSFMGSDSISGGIGRSNDANGKYTYFVLRDMGNKPVNYVSWYDAIRFTNWLNNGQGNADTESGAYTILGETAIPSNQNNITRNVGAAWFLPSENEWYKAAYHQPVAQAGDTDSYWLYPTRSNSTPTVATANAVGDISNPGTNVANYDNGAHWRGGVTDGNVTTVGSAGPLSASFYGTADQGGNVWEWNETLFDASQKGVRGGGFYSDPYTLRPAEAQQYSVSGEQRNFGFRVATIIGVPEPSTLALAALGALGLLIAARRRR